MTDYAWVFGITVKTSQNAHHCRKWYMQSNKHADDCSLDPNVLPFTSQYIIHTLKLNLKDDVH